MSRNTLDLFSKMDISFKKKPQSLSADGFNDIEETRTLKGSSSYNFGKTIHETEHIRRTNSDDLNGSEGKYNSYDNFENVSPMSPFSLQNLTLDADTENRFRLHREYIKSFSEEVGSAEILYDSTNDEKLVVVAGTTEKLIENMVKESDSGYCIPFLLTYRYHTTGEKVLNTIVELFNSRTEENSEEITIRVINILKKWIEHLFGDFLCDKKLMGDLITFIGKTLPSTGNLEYAKQLQREIQAVTKLREEIKYDSSTSPTVPKPSVPKVKDGEKVEFLDLSPGEIARQLTINDFNMYKETPIVEYMQQAWNSKDPEATAPGVSKKIRYFNDLSYWAATEILFQPEIKKRVSVIKRLIHVAEKCVEYNNFNTAMAITAGLHLSSISRLKKTWKHVPTKSMEVFHDITKMMSTEQNYKYYRTALERAQPPVNPYIGVYLRDLTFIEVGNEDHIDKLVNFDKLRMVASVLRDVIKYQQMSFQFEEVPIIQNYLKSSVKLQDAALLKYSHLHEPSERSERDRSNSESRK